LATLLGLNKKQPPLSSVYVVLALASPFVQEALLDEGRNDLKKVPEWLSDPRRNRADDVPLATAAMRSLVDDSLPLEPLTEQNIEAILVRLEGSHNLAYGWNGTMDKDFVRTKAKAQASNPTRTTIRAALEYLDLFYQYGKPPNIIVSPPDTDSLEEDSRFEGAETIETSD
jgi:hypothetical protein